MILHEWRVNSFLQRVSEYPPKWCTYSAGIAGGTWNCCHLGAFCIHHTTMHHVTSCKATYVRCRMTGVLRATAVTRRWNGYRSKSQHIKFTIEKKILPPLLQGFESTTFWSLGGGGGGEGGNSSVVRAPDSWLKGRGFESMRERRRNFFSRVDFLCWLLFLYPFHPRVTAVARKRSRSFLPKVQVACYS